MLKKFRAAVQRQLDSFPEKYTQAEDRFVYELEEREGRRFWGAYFYLWWMHKRGELRMTRKRSIWRSMDGSPCYGKPNPRKNKNNEETPLT